MAKDAANKISSNGNNSESSSPPSASDNQKVPPLRIVLNSSSNQKSSSAPTAVPASQQKDLTKKDVKADPKSTERNHVKFAPPNKSRQGSQGKQGTLSGESEISRPSRHNNQDNNNSGSSTKEDNAITYSHLRRITRRSQKTIQTISNEEEESMSSMTSVDENINTNNSNSDNSNSALDNNASSNPRTNLDHGTLGGSDNSSNTAINSSAVTQSGSSAGEPPRRYKRRRVEAPEFQLLDLESQLGYNNYRPPHQNSFELFRNIRNQVDKKLRGLNWIQPKTPHGIREYMLAKGAYLLDGNKLGNGMNLYLNDDGSTRLSSISNYCTLKPQRINYSVPNRAEVPVGLPINTPLYNLFFEQERERHKMRMQHVKEREKLTLTAEQEVVRVYNKAALAVANQPEPFSACTMLKHQEIYNYVDNEGVIIMPNEPTPPELGKQDGVRTRRRQHDHIPVGTSGRGSEPTEKKDSSQTNKDNRSDIATTTESGSTVVVSRSESQFSSKDESTSDKTNVKKESNTEGQGEHKGETNVDGKQHEKDILKEQDSSVINNSQTDELQPDQTLTSNDDNEETTSVKQIKVDNEKKAGDLNSDVHTDEPTRDGDEIIKKSEKMDENSPSDTTQSDKNDQEVQKTSSHDREKSKKLGVEVSEIKEQVAMDQDDVDTIDGRKTKDKESNQKSPSEKQELSEDDKAVQGREEFLEQLQIVDDKWEKIRREMLIRHKNEAESLYAIQRLEWEWKAKEMGIIDIRETAIIDSGHVPKLNIYSQDY